ncbi:MAG TPA: ABC transporter permease [Jatrophihabitans sp.]|jgi:ABC-2 type transport system permease protein|nr:ABC transporter permease [Jatrophihabitans sp.]
MSAVDAAGAVQPVAGPVRGRRPARFGGRLLASEIGMVLRRRRNQLMLLALLAIPVVIGVAVKLTTDPRSGESAGLLGDITNNGIFVAFTALVVVIPVFLPMAVSVVVGESIAGEASSGTLRYLLTVPVSRTRLLLVKFAAAALWCLIIASVVASAGLAIGFALFPAGRVTLLSGTQTSLAGGIGRLALVVGYAALMMLAIATIGLFISTLTEVPIAAMAAVLAVAVLMQVLVAVPQLHVLRPWLISYYLLSFADVLRDPLSLAGLGPGVRLALGYILVFWLLAWARFSTKDISS